MKGLNFFAAFLLTAGLLIFISSCAKHPGCTDVNATNYNTNAQVDNGTCLYDVTFYFDENGPNATVSINGQTANITANYQTGAPACGVNATGCANFTLPVGSYPYSATSALTTWSGGTVVVNGNGCQDVLLPQSTGSVTFWTANSTFGTITITINGTNANFSGYFTGGVPLCGASGAATFDLPPGTYGYVASSTSGANWSGNISVSADVPAGSISVISVFLLHVVLYKFRVVPIVLRPKCCFVEH